MLDGSERTSRRITADYIKNYVDSPAIPSLASTWSTTTKTSTLVYIVQRYISARSRAFANFFANQVGKAYGCHLGPFKTPAREDDPRYLGINFYYDQEDLLRTRQQGAYWKWTIFRPEAVCGFPLGNPMNLSMVMAVYAAISRELGLPL